MTYLLTDFNPFKDISSALDTLAGVCMIRFDEYVNLLPVVFLMGRFCEFILRYYEVGSLYCEFRIELYCGRNYNSGLDEQSCNVLLGFIIITCWIAWMNVLKKKTLFVRFSFCKYFSVIILIFT